MESVKGDSRLPERRQMDCAATPCAHDVQEASGWIMRFGDLVPRGGSVLDVACGSGRHLRWFAQRGHRVTGVDRSPQALADCAGIGETLLADIENGAWPLAGRQFDGVVVTHYLWRPLLRTIVASVAPGGVLLYETFAVGNETVGRPSNPDFLLRPGELLDACRGELLVVAYENGFIEGPPARFVQRLAAVREARTTQRLRL